MSDNKLRLKTLKGRVLDNATHYVGKAIALETEYGQVILISGDIETLKIHTHILIPAGIKIDESRIDEVAVFRGKKVIIGIG